MADKNTATVKAETAKPGSGATQGSGADDRSLTLQNAQKSAAERAVEAEDALAKQLEADTESNTETETSNSEETTEEGKVKEEVAAETVSNDGTTETETVEGETEKEGEKSNAEESDDDDVAFDKKGRAFVRKNRLNKLLDKSNKYDEIIEKLAGKVIDPEKGEKSTDAVSQIQDRIKQAETALEESYTAIEKAKADFDGKAEVEASRARDKALRELSKAERELEKRKDAQESAQRNSKTEYQREIRAAEKQYETVRDELWNEDRERIAKVDPELDLDDEDSWFRQEVKKVTDQWQIEGNPLMLKPTAFRRAVELVADMHDINLPPVVQKAKPVPKTAQSVKSNTVVHRKNATVIANNSQGGKAPITDEQIQQKIRSMPPEERLELLSKIMESQQKAR